MPIQLKDRIVFIYGMARSPTKPDISHDGDIFVMTSLRPSSASFGGRPRLGNFGVHDAGPSGEGEGDFEEAGGEERRSKPEGLDVPTSAGAQRKMHRRAGIRNAETYEEMVHQGMEIRKR